MLNPLNDVVKSLDATEQLRRNAHFIAKNIDETPLAEIHFFRDHRTGSQTGLVVEFLQRE
jgi:hypothetical protein